MKRTEKILSMLLCVFLIASLFAGCESTSTTSPETDNGSSSNNSTGQSSTKELGGTITFWMQKYGTDPQDQQVFLDKIVQEFKEKTGVTVKYSIVDWAQALTKYTLASTGGEAPDVADTFFAYSQVKMGGNNYGPMIIDDVVDEIGSDWFYDFAKPECYIDGHWYALPWRGDTRAAVYNEQHFKEAGIEEFPKTYEELVEVGKKLTKTDANGQITRSGYLFSVGNARFDQTWWSIMAGFGGRLMNDDFSKFIFDSPEAIESLQFMQDSVYKHNIIPKNVIDPSYDSGRVYMAEKASIVLGVTPDFITGVRAQAPQLESVTKSALMPSKTGEGISSIAFAAPVCVYKTTKNPDAAKEFLKFFVSKDVQLEAMKAMNLVSTSKDVMTDPFFTSDPWSKNFVDQTALAIPGDMPLPAWSQIDAFPQGPLNNMCTKIMAGEDVKQCVDEAIAEANRILAESE